LGHNTLHLDESNNYTENESYLTGSNNNYSQLNLVLIWINSCNHCKPGNADNRAIEERLGMKTSKTWTLALGLALVLGCTVSDEGPDQSTSDGFELVQHSDTTIEANITSGAQSLHMLVVEVSPGVVDVTYDFGDPIIAFTLNFNSGVGDFMPNGSALDAAQSRLITELLGNLTKTLNPDTETRSRVEDVTFRQGSFMQIVPTGEKLVQGTFVSQRGWSHISSSCSNQYLGSGNWRTCGKGCGCNGGSGNGCKGRCGQGCGGTSSPGCYGSTVYTKDCAKHDYGLGSWWSASDDYAFASNNASCGGNCY